MSLVDGEGKPIPPGSWGGDLDPSRQATCVECGCSIPFGKFCPEHLAAARAKNEELMAERRGSTPDQVPPPPNLPPPAHEVDMTVLMAQAQERAQAIVTPGAEVPPSTDHLAKSGPVDSTRTVGLNAGMLNQAGLNDTPPQSSGLILPASASNQIRLERRSDDFLIGQAVMWLGELRGLAEEGKVKRESAAEILQLAAELTYALAGILK